MKRKVNDPNTDKEADDEKYLPRQLEPESGLSDDQRKSYIAEAAYYKSEKRGFQPGFEEQDWIEAEREIRESMQENRAA